MAHRYADVEDQIREHPEVRECAVIRVPAAPRKTALTAYVVTGEQLRPAEIRAFLASSPLPAGRLPRTVVFVPSLPRTATGEIDRDGLPLRVTDTVRPPSGGKGSPAELDSVAQMVFFLVVTAVLGGIAFALTNSFWPGSTDLSDVPDRFTGWFTALYVAECLAFGAGVSVLLFGHGWLAELGRPRWLTVLAQVALAWLLAAWWPQDNLYRLAAKTDWARQQLLVYVFNIPLMIAAAVLVLFVARPAD
ncbi:hypothetical protein [Amycolatopsis sp. NPDC051128]|uniref:AMP-binding enzyme n=1 Tax=Amycolatopsis sp. NPDC051128 TaxID=3155412 RepID=UPI0034120F0E